VLELPMIEEARRQLDVCNACRYCEGLCAVFPALERRSFFDVGDMAYLANLCHDCRSCFDACPYAPPHELAVDIPLLMSTIRERTYVGYAWPRGIAERVDRRVRDALAFAGIAVVLIVGATLLANGVEGMFVSRRGAGSFYEVVPWLAMMLPFSALTVAAIGIMLVGGVRFWRDTGRGVPASLLHIGALLRAAWDAGTLRNLGGGGPGCTYPDEAPTHRRRVWHSLVFYGFISAFISTALAAVYQDILGVLPPYDILSAPVIFGTVGGAAMMVGCIGLLAQKRTSDEARIARPMRAMDVAFIASLLLINVSGTLLLALRETPLMGILLAAHLGFVAALFVTLPYGKFAHAIYRLLALTRNSLEQLRDG
jgi:citrate/tricarballylate utilization protein